MSEEHANTTRVREMVEALQRGDVEAVISYYTADANYRAAGDNLVSGSFQGHSEIRDYFTKLGELTGGSVKIDLTDVLADDHHAVVFWTITAQRAGKSLDATGAMAFEIDDSGKFTESWFLYADQRAYDEFYS